MEKKRDGGQRSLGNVFYLFVRRNMLLSRKSGIEKLESAVHKDSDIIPQGGHSGESGRVAYSRSYFSAPLEQE